MNAQKKLNRVHYLKMQVTGPRVVLRPYRFTDFKKCVAAHQARLPLVDRFDQAINTSQETLASSFKRRLLNQRKAAKEQRHFVFGVFDKKTDAHIGQVGISIINHSLSWANLGYGIHNQYFGKGYASEAATLALKIAFHLTNLHRVEAGMETDHKASEKVSRKAGLKFEGKRTKFFRHNGGTDMNIYAINSIDYRARRPMGASKKA